MSSIYEQNLQNIQKKNPATRNPSLKLFQPLSTKILSQKYLSYLGPFIWNGLPDEVKLSNKMNTFKHKIKKSLLKLLREKHQCVYVYYG